MLKPIISLTVQNGMLRENYTIDRDTVSGDIFLSNCLDVDGGGPTDMMHIAPQAFGHLATIFATLADPRTAMPEVRLLTGEPLADQMRALSHRIMPADAQHLKLLACVVARMETALNESAHAGRDMAAAPFAGRVGV